MQSRLFFAVKVFLSVAIVFFLSAFFMRYITLGDKPELNRNQVASELSDMQELAHTTIIALKDLPHLLTAGATGQAQPTPYSELIPEDMKSPIAVPQFVLVDHAVASPLPAASAPADIRMMQVLGTASAHPAD